MGNEGEGGRRPCRKLTAEERAHFLEVLRETGNRRFAAEAIGEEPRLMDQRRAFDPELDREWEAAVEEADRRLSGAARPFDCPPGTPLGIIKRGRKGRLQLVAARDDQWNAEVEERFMEALRGCGNVRAAAHAVGFHQSTVWNRRRLWPAFAQALEEMLEEAELALEFRIACMGNNVLPADPANDADAEEGDAESPESIPFDADLAMRFLKWRDEKRRGGRRGPHPKPPSIEEVTETILRRVAAIKRHRQREAEE